ncbi:PAS domain-containing protein [Urbifossiella limnaea]|uniref:histidine kinase n=1 Tax=Urbifossiella limnaea TaxID=2528023 RepID=A0A517XQ97_9BACT|nr:PAS domain-containing protein [Urbifossiella limnaea]QDU19679.1 PAS fold protein [Urbifossiella limnaea]
MPADPIPVRGLEIHPLQTFVADTDGAIEYFNPRCPEYTGLPTDDLLGWDWRWVVHPDDIGRTLDRWAASVRDGTAHDNDVRLRGADAAYRWFRVRVEPVRDAAGAVVRWVGACTDIDDLRQAGDEARDARRLVRAFLDRGGEGRALVGGDGVVRYASPALVSLVGGQQEAVAGTDARGWVHRDDRPRVAQAVTDLLLKPGERVDGTVRLRHAGGSYRRVWVEATNLLPDPDVRAVAVVIEPENAG